MSQPTIDPNAIYNLEFRGRGAEYVRSLIKQRPYEEVEGLIAEMNGQIDRQNRQLAEDGARAKEREIAQAVERALKEKAADNVVDAG